MFMSEHAATLFDALPHLQGPKLDGRRASSLVIDAMNRYSEPWRHHHVVAHLSDVVGFLLENVEELENPRRTLWAGIDHDIVYVPQAIIPGANEELSAQLNEKRLISFLPAEEVESMGRFIRTTADHEWDGEDNDLAYLLDADLKMILGAPEEEFDRYDINISHEYAFVPPHDYVTARKRILRNFYDQDRLFITDVAHQQFEDQAKANLDRRLSQF